MGGPVDDPCYHCPILVASIIAQILEKIVSIQLACNYFWEQSPFHPHQGGMGAVISHVLSEGDERSIAFADPC